MEISEERKQLAKDMLNSLPFAKLLGMRLTDIGHGEAVVEIEMRDELRQIGGILHGGVTATVIDTAMAFALRSYLDDTTLTATIGLTVHYLRPHSEGTLTCTARVVKPGKRIFTVSAEAMNNDGKLVATAVSSYTTV